MPSLAIRFTTLLCCTCLAVAQRPAAPPAFALRTAHGAMLDEHAVPWLLGHDYKACFVDGAMHFVPALGANHTGDATLSYELLSIHRDEAAPIADASPDPRAAEVTATSVSVKHGAVREVYDARAEGVELAFVFGERPMGTGDLVVRGRIGTRLAAVAADDDGTLRFADAAGGGVTIGGATGVDADGRRSRGTTRLVGDVVEWRLPADFVDAATYPMTLDPLFGAALLPGGTSLDDDDVAAAYDATNDIYLVVWSRTFSATDADIRGQRVTGSGALTGPLFAITSANTDEHGPAVASVNSRDRFVVCWQEGPGPFGPYDVNCRSVDAATGTLGGTVGIGVSAGNDVMPAISGDRSAIGSQALICWNAAGSGLLARTASVSTSGAITAGTTKVVTTSSGLVSPPRLVKGRQPGETSLVVWVTAVGFFSISARAISYAGDPLGAETSVDILLQDADVTMDGTDSQFLVVWDNGQNPATVRMRPVQWNGTSLTLGTQSTMANLGNPSEYALGLLGDRYLLAWRQPTANPFDGELRAVTVKPDCTQCSTVVSVPTALRSNQRAPAIAPHFAATSNAPAAEALLLWNETDATPPFASNVVGQRFAAMLGVPPVVLSPGCPGGGTGGTDGPFALGNAGFHFTLSGGDPAAPLAILALGDGSQPGIPCGCAFIQSVLTFVVPTAAGSASFPVAVPCDPLLLGIQLEYQWVLIGTGGSPCPFLPNFSASDRRLVTLAE